MNKIQLGKSDLNISPIVFGAWAIGGWRWGGSNDKEALEAMHAGFDHGVTSIDTAPVYGFGHSEELVGKAIRGMGRNKVEILTKFCLRWDTDEGEFAFYADDRVENAMKIHAYAGRDGIMKEVEDSLRRLGTDYIDLYQIHRPDATTPIEETMEALLLLKEQGKIREAAVSNYSVAQMKEAEEVIRIASNQVPYSMVYRKIERELVPHCLESGNGILAYSPLQRGLLTGKITADHVFKEGDHRPSNKFFKEPNRSRTNAFLERIRPIANDRGLTLGQLVINWTLQRPAISALLVGARNAPQMEENAKALDLILSEEEIGRIDAEVEKLEIVDP